MSGAIELKNQNLGLDIPFALYGVAKVVTWRDHHVVSWTKATSLFKQITVKTTAEIAIALLLAFSVAEFVLRNIAFLISTPLFLTPKHHIVTERLGNSAMTSIHTALFCLEALRHNLVENRVGQKMTSPRLSSYFLDFYSKAGL